MSKERTQRVVLGGLEDEDEAKPFFLEAAAREGLTYHEWCLRHGVIDLAALNKIERHETPARHRDMWPNLRRYQF